MFNKKRPSPVAVASPTINELELESNLSLTATTTNPNPNTKTKTTTITTATLAISNRDTTKVHVTALDGIVNVNSLFTMAIFIGFSLTNPQAATAASSPECTVSHETVRNLIVYEVVSFSFFLFSSLIAQSMKLVINLVNNMNSNDHEKAEIDLDCLKHGLFASAIGSILGCLFLMLSIIDFVQVKLGDLKCGGKPVYAVGVLVGFIGPALIVYIVTAGYAAFFVDKVTDDAEESSRKDT